MIYDSTIYVFSIYRLCDRVHSCLTAKDCLELRRLSVKEATGLRMIYTVYVGRGVASVKINPEDIVRGDFSEEPVLHRPVPNKVLDSRGYFRWPHGTGFDKSFPEPRS